MSDYYLRFLSYTEKISQMSSIIYPGRRILKPDHKKGFHLKLRTLIHLIVLFLLILQMQVSGNERWRAYINEDLAQFRRQLNFRTVLIAGGWLAGMYLLSDFDPDLNCSVKTVYHGGWKKYFDTIDYLGYAPYSIPVSFGITGLTLLGDDKKLQDAAFTSSEAAVVSGVAVSLVKIILGRTRPDKGQGPRNFIPFSDLNSSFPSGHSSTAFALVTPWICYYPGPFTYMLLIFPASTAVARMVQNRHWFTDVLTGSVIGSIIGVSLAKWHKDLAAQKKYYYPPQPPPILISFSFNL
jgi:hypothetical protein